MLRIIGNRRITCLNLFHRIGRINMSSTSLPAHIVVGMPALSPTMSTGTIGKWTCKVGDKINAGDSLAEIETDKASMAFEAQDEFYIAKLLVESGVEVKVGDAILVSVENPADINAFNDFKVQVAPSTTAAITAPEPVVSAPIVPKVETIPVKPITPAPVLSTPVTSTTNIDTSAIYFTKWSNEVGKSPLGKKLASAQAEYIKKYGTPGQKAL